MQPIHKHKCAVNPDRVIVLWKEGERWCLEIGDGYFNVTYCPDCGIKL